MFIYVCVIYVCMRLPGVGDQAAVDAGRSERPFEPEQVVLRRGKRYFLLALSPPGDESPPAGRRLLGVFHAAAGGVRPLCNDLSLAHLQRRVDDQDHLHFRFGGSRR